MAHQAQNCPIPWLYFLPRHIFSLVSPLVRLRQAGGRLTAPHFRCHQALPYPPQDHACQEPSVFHDHPPSRFLQLFCASTPHEILKPWISLYVFLYCIISCFISNILRFFFHSLPPRPFSENACLRQHTHSLCLRSNKGGSEWFCMLCRKEPQGCREQSPQTPKGVLVARHQPRCHLAHQPQGPRTTHFIRCSAQTPWSRPSGRTSAALFPCLCFTVLHRVPIYKTGPGFSKKVKSPFVSIYLNGPCTCGLWLCVE